MLCLVNVEVKALELCAVISFLSQKAIPHNARVPAQLPFHKQLTEKRKDNRLCHLLPAKELPEFHYDLPQPHVAS
jgi:hypothetical protein